ncbi:DUF2975 domain-containing protein [Porphyrobacter sp. AAP60]|uniref:DUF2975 domain-containing protein n=1 Tax=Porphyrobacter sp. AAP60 TaxID=1523423 RepID=UPI0006B949EE|nr:DUF2975 domain-containing protein [Porphyrobacter sp. AAP60]KPF63078.1 hypothetical protein IP79_11005 [Porphyrobacter sp. AAP60]
MLRFAHSFLGLLNVLNWAVGVPMLVLFAIAAIDSSAFSDQMRSEFSPQETAALVEWLRVAAAATLVTIPLAHIIFTRLRAMIRDAQSGLVFSLASIARLRTVAFCLLGVCIVDLVFGIASINVSEKTGEYLGWSPSLTPWLVAGLLFVLARIFSEGVTMREELEGTV